MTSRSVHNIDIVKRATERVESWDRQIGEPVPRERSTARFVNVGRRAGGIALFALLLLTKAATRLRISSVALKLARAALAFDDGQARAHWELAKLLLQERRGRQGTASTSFDRELLANLRVSSQSGDGDIGPAAAIAYAEELYRTARYSEALDTIDSLPAAAPRRLRLLRTKANSLLAIGRIAESVALYEELAAAEGGDESLKTRLDLLTPLTGSPSATVAPENGGASILIGLGGGIGDMLHVSPALRNIARRTGERVDVLVMPDHPGAEFLACNPEWVNRVWIPSPDVLNRRYETVLLTHSFGPLRFPFNADRTMASDAWRQFRPGQLNETLFNFEAVRHLLGIDYTAADLDGYFAGNLRYSRPGEVLVGVNSGSKPGRWMSKRWPHFPQLARRLAARGLRVASFGSKDEYVDGTEDCTGGTVEQMSRAMLACTHFVSNDSGPMHIANALGIPVLAIFAPTDPFTHLPLRASTRALAAGTRCAPCEVKNHRYFASGQCRCVAEVTPAEVERELLQMIGGVSMSEG